MLTQTKNTRFRNVLALFLACIMIFSCLILTGSADTTLEEDKSNYKDLENQLASIKKSQASLQTSINKAKNDKNSAIKLKTELDKEIELKSSEIELYNALVESYNIRISDIEKDAKEIEEEMYETYKKFIDRLVITYETSSAEYIDFILSAGDFSDFLSRMEYTTDLIEFERNVLNGLTKDKEDLDLRAAELTNASNRCAEILDLSEKEMDNLEDKKNYANSLIAAYENDIVKYQQLEKEAKQDMEDLKDIMTELAKQIKDKEAEAYTGGLMKWPLDQTYYITSEYGNRTHPVTGEVQSFHNGIDIGVYGGTPYIYAPGPGTVIYAGVKGTYGNCVMISHGFDEKGRNIVTLYAHLSKISVKNGQKIKTGNIIGKVGSTGRSTGNHLHLTVMVDGTPVDPGQYIKIAPARKK